MTRSRVLLGFLFAFVCAAAQAQECSGGVGGGVDATGNQCNAPAQAVDATLTVAVPAPVAAVWTVARATPNRQPAARASTPAPTAVPVAGSPDRFTVGARPRVAPVQTAKVEIGEEAMCSGGVEGGMDATGNQCNPVAIAGGAVVVAGVSGR